MFTANLIIIDTETSDQIDEIQEAKFIPRIGESLQFVDQILLVKDVIYEIDIEGSMTRNIRIFVE